MRKFPWLTVIFFLSLSKQIFGLQSFNEIENFVIEDNNWRVFQSENISAKKINKKTVFQLNENTEANPDKLDLYLDFETALNNLKNYKVIFSDFDMNRYQSVNGSYSGKFYLSGNFISLLPTSSSLLSPGNNPGSFTIEFWIYLYKNYDNQYVIKYIGNNLSDENDKNVYGFSVFTKNNRMVYQFDNFFWSDKKESFSFTIQDDENLELNKWEHHAVSFDIMNGKLTTSRNGIEQEVKWITVDGKPRSEILNPHIKDELSTPMLIGKNGIFALDNFKISKDASQNFYLKKYNNQNSFLITDVYQYSKNISTLKNLNFQFKNPDYSYVKLAYRVSDQYFLPDNSQLPWIYVQNNIDDFPSLESHGRYIQFKVMAYPYEEMTKEITIQSIHVVHSADASPYLPILVNVTPMDGSGKITWIPSPEDDIAGYELYYGNRSEDYVCEDATEGKSPIFIPAKEIGKLNPLDFTITSLINEKPYFISIRTVDKNGHRSPFSKEMYFRPSTVFNEKKYSIGR